MVFKCICSLGARFHSSPHRALPGTGVTSSSLDALTSLCRQRSVPALSLAGNVLNQVPGIFTQRPSSCTFLVLIDHHFPVVRKHLYPPFSWQSSRWEVASGTPTKSSARINKPMGLYKGKARLLGTNRVTLSLVAGMKADIVVLGQANTYRRSWPRNSSQEGP